MPNDRTRADIRPVKERIEDQLLQRPEVTGVDIAPKRTGGRDTGELAIVVYVQEKKPEEALDAGQLIPGEIDGVRTDVVEERIVLHVGAALVEAPLAGGATAAALQGGVSMGPCRSVHLVPPEVPQAGEYIFVGTLGAIVTDRASGVAMALTNFHVACIDSHWSVGDRMTQPGRNDGGTCPVDGFATLTRAVLSEHVDGAVVAIDSGRSTRPAIDGIGEVQGSAAAVLHEPVRKRGRTTELTSGTIVSTDYSTSVDYGGGLGVRTLKHQLRVQVDRTRSTRFGDHGDSGSVVVNAANEVVGLHFAGNTSGSIGIANPIQPVLDELRVDLDVSRPPAD